MADTPLGRGLIEIGANLAPLEKGLAEAQAKTRAALGGAAVGGGAASSGVSSGVSSAAGSIKQQAQDTNQAATATRNLAAATATASTTTKVATGTYATFNATLKSVGVSISAATAGFRAAISSITAVVGAFTAALGIFGLVAAAISAIVNALKEQKQAQEDARVATQNANKVYTEIANNPFFKNKTDIESRIQAIDDERQRRIDMINQVYNAQLAANAKLDEDERRVKDAEAKEDAIKAVQNQEKLTKVALEQLNMQIDNEIQATIDAEKKKNQEIQKSLLGPRERLLADHAEKVAQIEEAIAKNANAERGAEMQQIHRERLNLLQQELNKNLENIDKEEKEKADALNRSKIESQKAAKEFAEAQRAAFGQLQGQINSLFNTGNMEVGINRVAGLIQVLIDKTERG